MSVSYCLGSLQERRAAQAAALKEKMAEKVRVTRQAHALRCA